MYKANGVDTDDRISYKAKPSGRGTSKCKGKPQFLVFKTNAHHGWSACAIESKRHKQPFDLA